MTRHTTHHILPVLLAVLTLIMSACSKDESFTTDKSAILQFSDDTIKFDTVFTTIASSTDGLMIYNRNNNGVRLTDIRLKNPSTTGFRINLDGQFGTSFSDIDLYGGDSLFCFVEVTLPTQSSDTPVLVSDEIIFTLQSGVQHRIILQAYGQDATILKSPVISTNTTYTSTRPYLIYGTLKINQGATLTLDPGSRLYFHADAGIQCEGTLYADGSSDKEILLRGDRLDKMFWYLPYDRLDNQWQGIEFTSTSKGNYLNHTDIHGGLYGIIASAENTETTQLTLLNSTIHNVGGNGLTLTKTAATVANCQITNCRGHCISILGGSYDFYFCTIAQFCPWIADRGHAILFSNGTDASDYKALEQLNITNSLITGYASDEVFGSPVEKVDNAQFNFKFQNCLLCTPEPTSYKENFLNCAYQTTDQKTNFRTFDTENFIYDFRLTEGSAARAKGTNDGGILDLYPTDRNGIQRNPASIDVGCYQFQ